MPWYSMLGLVLTGFLLGVVACSWLWHHYLHTPVDFAPGDEPD